MVSTVSAQAQVYVKKNAAIVSRPGRTPAIKRTTVVGPRGNVASSTRAVSTRPVRRTTVVAGPHGAAVVTRPRAAVVTRPGGVAVIGGPTVSHPIAPIRPGLHVHYGWYRPTWYYPVGYTIAALATTAILVDALSTPTVAVYYDNGVYYQKSAGTYTVIQAPVGAKVSRIPEGYTVVSLNDTQYYYAAGDFYVLTSDNQYVVAEAPVGITVPYLPEDGTKIFTYNNVQYYKFGNVCYMQSQLNGNIAYKVVTSPI